MPPTLVLLPAAVALLAPAVVAVCRRPQRGLLLLAALLPFDGLLLVVPGGEAAGPWKEALLVATLLATLVAPASARRAAAVADGAPDRLPPWVPAAAAYTLLGAISAALVGGAVGAWGLKIGFFYLLVPVVLWRCPFDARERDRLVSVLMATGVAVAAVGLLQQVWGAERLHDLGYEYDTAIRFSGDLLRSFSTFTQPFSFGLYVATVLLVCLPVALAEARRPRNLAFLVSAPLLVLAMAASVVRGAALALLVGLVVLAVWRFRAMAHALAPAAVGLLLVPAPALAAYLSSTSLGERTTGWAGIADLVVAAPLGHGVGTTGAAAEKTAGLGVDPDRLITAPDGSLYLPDNQYVKTLLELGPVGLWLLLLLGAGVLAAAVAAARRSTHGLASDRALAQGIAAAVAGAAAASVVSTYLEIFPLDFYVWLFAGALTCIPDRSRSTPSPSAPAAAGSRPTSVSSSGP